METTSVSTPCQMPAGQPPVNRKRFIAPPQSESANWNYLNGVGPSAPRPEEPKPKPFRPEWKTKRPEEAINQAAERVNQMTVQEKRRETTTSIRRDMLTDKGKYNGYNPINHVVYDEQRAAVKPQGKKHVPMRPMESEEKLAQKQESAAYRLQLRQDRIAKEGLRSVEAKGASVKDNFDPLNWNPDPKK